MRDGADLTRGERVLWVRVSVRRELNAERGIVGTNPTSVATPGTGKGQEGECKRGSLAHKIMQADVKKLQKRGGPLCSTVGNFRSRSHSDTESARVESGCLAIRVSRLCNEARSCLQPHCSCKTVIAHASHTVLLVDSENGSVVQRSSVGILDQRRNPSGGCTRFPLVAAAARACRYDLQRTFSKGGLDLVRIKLCFDPIRAQESDFDANLP